jgi:hypothetical protein
MISVLERAKTVRALDRAATVIATGTNDTFLVHVKQMQIPNFL